VEDLFFVFSPDRKYVLKTITEGESKLLRKILPEMYTYLSRNEHSLMVRFYGCHAVVTPHGGLIHVAVMSNVFCSPAETVDEPYDLKGSWVNRCKGELHTRNPSMLGLDLDLKHKLLVSPDQRSRFESQIANDAKFLSQLNIMDYSLLLGIHKVRPSEGVTHSEKLGRIEGPQPDLKLGRLVSTTGEYVYFLGMIDILQLYDKNKKLERFIKVYILRKDRNGVSVTNPEKYCERFIQRMENLFETNTIVVE